MLVDNLYNRLCDLLNSRGEIENKDSNAYFILGVWKIYFNTFEPDMLTLKSYKTGKEVNIKISSIKDVEVIDFNDSQKISVIRFTYYSGLFSRIFRFYSDSDEYEGIIKDMSLVRC